MLKVLRPYVKPDGRLFYTVFVNETTNGGFGYIDHWTKSITERAEIDESFREAFASAEKDYTVPDFLDRIPSQPLKVAMYSREHALRLVENTGWEVESLNDPVKEMQHYMVCKPA